MLAGGGLKQGFVVGATNSKAEYPSEREVAPHDLLATVYRVLGIDPTTHFLRLLRPPVALVDRAEASVNCFVSGC